MRNTVLFLFLAGTTTSCSHLQYRPVANEGGLRMTNCVVSIHRSSCYGECPSFSLSVYRDGVVLYEGLSNVVRTGFWVSKVPIESIRKLLEDFDRAGFCSFPGMSEVNPQSPSTTIELHSQRCSHAVKYYPNIGPREFYKLAEHVESIADTKQLVGR